MSYFTSLEELPSPSNITGAGILKITSDSAAVSSSAENRDMLPSSFKSGTRFSKFIINANLYCARFSCTIMFSLTLSLNTLYSKSPPLQKLVYTIFDLSESSIAASLPGLFL